MNCFYHPDRSAVAMCKSCNRGLCPNCVTDVAPGVACRGKCEADVAALNLVLQLSKTAYQKTGVAHRRNALVMLIIGLCFLAFGVLPIVTAGSYGAFFMMPLGAVFLLWAYFSYRSGKQIAEVSGASDRTAGDSRPLDR